MTPQEALARADHEQIIEERGGCGDHMESFDDHMAYHLHRAERIVARLDGYEVRPIEQAAEAAASRSAAWADKNDDR